MYRYRVTNELVGRTSSRSTSLSMNRSGASACFMRISIFSLYCADHAVGHVSGHDRSDSRQQQLLTRLARAICRLYHGAACCAGQCITQQS